MSRHEPDWLALCCGLIFTALGLGYVVTSALGVRIDAVWVLPALLVALGAAGIVATAQANRGRGDDRPED